MKLSVLTMITKPDERQDLWREALENYKNFADEIVVVVGDMKTYKQCVESERVKFVYLEWFDDWDYVELPRHLNYGLRVCTGDWVLKLDIDQLIPEHQVGNLKTNLQRAEQWKVEALALEKMSYFCDGRYKLKGKQPILFKRLENVEFGEAYDLDQKHRDLCQPIIVSGHKYVDDYPVPTGDLVKYEDSSVLYWNFSYTFKNETVAREHFWRFVRAYRGYFNSDVFGKNKTEALEYFKKTVKKGYLECAYTAKLHELPKEMRRPLNDLKPEQLGYNLWGLVWQKE